MQDAGEEKTDVDVCPRHREQACPRPSVVLDVEHGDASPELMSRAGGKGAREAVELSAGEMPERMAPERVPGQQEHVGEHQHAAQADAEMAAEVKRDYRVEPQEGDLDHGGVEGEP